MKNEMYLISQAVDVLIKSAMTPTYSQRRLGTTQVHGVTSISG